MMKNFRLPSEIAGLPYDTPVLVAYSGGADSGALLHMLCEYSIQNKGKIKIAAAHLNHMIRGKEADRDEAFCRATAQKYGIEFFCEKTDVPAYARERSLSIETAARELRYAFFKRIMRKNNIPILATAHNADDNLETIIMNLARGTGLAGLCGRRKGCLLTVPRCACSVQNPDTRIPRSTILNMSPTAQTPIRVYPYS